MPQSGIVFGILTGYLTGSIPFAWIAARMSGVGDLRATGSGNLGATNVYRTSGLAAGLAVAALDIGKGAASVLAARRLDPSATAAAAAAVAAVVGHVFPVWLRFRGGKGVATACGAFVVLAPVAAALAASIFVVMAWVTRYVSLASIVAAAALPSLVYMTRNSEPTLVASFLMAAIVLVGHRGNIARLLAGEERGI